MEINNDRKIKMFRRAAAIGTAAAVVLGLLFAGGVFRDWPFLPYRIDPVAFAWGPVRIHWYGLMYVAALLTSYGLIVRRLHTEVWDVSESTIADFLTWSVAGVLLGGRLGYVLFYKPLYFLQHPLEMFLPFQFDGRQWFFGIYGMSYHGGLLGMAAATVLFCRRRKMNVLRFADLIVPAVPLGYAFGRLGNFINGELYGRPATVPWAMSFPLDPAHLPRHPSQLYEMFFEGIVLFAFLWTVRNRAWARRRIFALYLIGYGLIRFGIEFFREPDAHLGFVFGPLTMGQVLCGVMVAAGVLLFNNKNIDKKSNNVYS